MDQMILFQQWWQENYLFLSLFLLFFSFLYLFRILQKDKLNLPPSPPRLPIIGNLHQLRSLPHRSFRTLSQKHGPVMLLHFGQAPMVIVSSAELVGEIIKNHDVAFAGRPQTRVTNVLFIGCTDIGFSPYGEYWRQVKKIAVVELLSQKRVQQSQFVREEEVAKVVERLRLSSLNRAAVDLRDIFLTVTCNIVSRSAFGRLYENGGGGKSFGEMSRTVTNLIAAFCFKDMFPSLGWMDYATGLVQRLKDASKELHDFLDQVIDEHQDSTSNDKSAKQDMVDILLKIQKDDTLGIHLTRDNLKAILMDTFVGATDTTTSHLEWAMAELVKNPTIMKKAQEEVRSVVGDKPKLDEADIDQMGFLKCIVKETLRLHPLGMIARETSASVKLGGYDIPPKTKVLINSWAMQRDPEMWNRPEEFVPERFANISVDFKGQHPKFIPFGWGRRICPGTSYAVAEAELLLANLLHWFDWELPDSGRPEDLDMSEFNTLFVHRKTPLLLVPVLHSP